MIKRERERERESRVFELASMRVVQEREKYFDKERNIIYNQSLCKGKKP